MHSRLWAITLLLLAPISGVLAQSPPATQAQEKLYSLDVEDEPVRDVLKRFFAEANQKYLLTEDVTGFVTLKIKDLPFETALKGVMRAAYLPLTYTKEDGLYKVMPRLAPGPLPVEGEVRKTPPRITLDLHLAPLPQTLEKLLTEAKVRFVIDPEISGVVTLRLQKVTWPVALTEILCAAESAYAWRMDRDGTLYVYPKKRR